MAVAVVLLGVTIADLAERRAGLDDLSLYALLIAYPLGLAVALPRLRPCLRGEHLGWAHALPLLLHALAALWGALGILADVVSWHTPDGLRAALEMGRFAALIAFVAGWIVVLGVATRSKGAGLLLCVSTLVPAAWFALVAITLQRDRGAG